MTQDTTIKNCLQCGKSQTRQQIRGQYRYCSRDCYYAARYGEETIWGDISIRGAKRVEALKLCHEGMTQREAAKALDLHRSVVQRLFKGHSADNILPEQYCAACGKSLMGIGLRIGRKYCSKECSYQMYYSKTYPGRERVPVDREARQRALELYWRGLDSGSIARHLSVSKKTVRSWIHRYGSEKKREICSQALKLGALRHWLREAETSTKWRGILEAAADENSESKTGEIQDAGTSSVGTTRTVHLISICVNGQAEWGYYAGIVIDRVKMNPFSGETFAFCNHLRNTVTAITWQNGTFLLTRARKASGTYLWPPENLGVSLLVSDGAFWHLLSYQKTNRKPKGILENP